jgi:C1A family cysteine protease
MQAYFFCHLTSSVAVNKFSDMTAEEISLVMMPSKSTAARAFSRAGASGYHQLSGKQLPASINWVEKGAVNPPKDQGVCGSCWTFGTAGSLEGAWYIEVMLFVDCATGS